MKSNRTAPRHMAEAMRRGRLANGVSQAALADAAFGEPKGAGEPRAAGGGSFDRPGWTLFAHGDGIDVV